MNKIINGINFIISEYINDREMRTWIKNNMVYYRNRLNEKATNFDAFSYVIQSPISRLNVSKEEEKAIINTLWEYLESKNHSLTRVI